MTDQCEHEWYRIIHLKAAKGKELVPDFARCSKCRKELPLEAFDLTPTEEQRKALDALAGMLVEVAVREVRTQMGWPRVRDFPRNEQQTLRWLLRHAAENGIVKAGVAVKFGREWRIDRDKLPEFLREQTLKTLAVKSCAKNWPGPR